MEIDEKKNPWTTLSSEVKYENPWIRITEHQVVHPSGKEGIYGAVHFKNWALGIVPLDDQGYTWLVGQYRYVMNRYSWEIPEGGGALDKDPLSSAQRELKEETGLIAAHWEKILEIDISNSATDERAKIYLATGLQQGKSEPEDSEQLQVRRIKLSEAYEMVLRGEITDAISAIALIHVFTRLKTQSDI